MKQINFTKEEVSCILHVIKLRFASVTPAEMSQPKFIRNEFYYPLFKIREKLENNETKFLKKEINIMKINLNNFGTKKEITELNGFKKISFIKI
ncbi:hypothetical protein [Maribacter sp. Asnod1-A12]|uniref:hypothetical protein n=1 Tax=Maribacter sp. Asnod1-A12 TaxID=3160576 RepID=UPI00386D8A1C